MQLVLAILFGLLAGILCLAFALGVLFTLFDFWGDSLPTNPRKTRASGASAEPRQFTELSERRTHPSADRRVGSPTDQSTRRQAGHVVIEGLTVIGGFLVFSGLAYFFLVIS